MQYFHIIQYYIPQMKRQRSEKEEQIRQDQEQIPDHFYDSDIASVNEKDFQSDSEPPKDIILERKLLFKEKMLHVYKTILKVGTGIDRPAPYDEIKLRFKKKIKDDEEASNINFLNSEQFITYNLGNEHEEVERLVTSMKVSEVALFEIQQLEISKKTNIKILKQRQTYAIEVINWTTVIDLDGNKKMFKYIKTKGCGPHRVHQYDEVQFNYKIECNGNIVKEFKDEEFIKMEEKTIEAIPKLIWKILSSMKVKQIAEVRIKDEFLRQIQKQELYKNFIESEKQQQRNWLFHVEVVQILKVDDFNMNGSILKKTLIKGVSTAKPDSSSLVYYALKFFDDNHQVLHIDSCYGSDWWEDFQKLDELGCRKNYLDEYKLSKMLKSSIKRMKPAEIAEIQCREMKLFEYGQDYQELKTLWPKQKEFPPEKVFIQVRVYNFTEGKTCFNMNIEEKIKESKRKKQIGIKLLKQGKFKKAFKKFQNIVAFYNSGEINKEGYEEKISALMNSTLCLMKEEKFLEMIPLCNLILEKPRHGYDPDKMKIKGPQGLKIEGDIKDKLEKDQRKQANLEQSEKILDKCLYRKACALLKIGQSKEAFNCITEIKQKNDETQKLKKQAEKQTQIYEIKSKKMYKNMFG